MAHRRLHYVLSTHWDREWYQPFQDYRYRLVQLVDRIIAGLDDGRLKGPFQADGQSVMIEDYLEVRAGQREHVQQLVRQGKIRLGPWYTMPDEFIVSGESLVRNLRLGRQVARQLGGKPSEAGFVCDIFGHNSQLPQIFAGFGIRFGFIWRGTNLASRLVRWRGADGTELPCYRFGKVGYCSYCSTVRCKFADARVPVDVEALNKATDQFIEEELAATEVGPGLMFDGGDHLEWDPRTYALMPLGQVRHGALLIHSTLDDYIAEMLPLASQFTQVLSGELRQPGRPPLDQDTQWVIPGVLSSRAPMKQHNDRCQTLLCQWAEPLGVLAGAAVDMPYPADYLEVAWKYVLKNHAHDSICGCSIDEVHQDCAYRFRQAEQIAQRLATESTRKLAASIEPEVKEDEVRVVVFNPLAQPFEGKADLWIKVPVEWPTSNEFFGFEPQPTFHIFDAAGQEVPYQRLDQSMHVRNTRIFDIGFPKGYQTHDVRVALPLRIPAMGYTTLTVRKPEPTRSIRYPVKPGLATSERSMANEHLEVSIESNGTLTVRDKRSGQTYSRLLTFEDSADIGDGWYHGIANNDQAFVSTAGSADVALLHDGPMLCTFRVRLRMNVPRGFEKSSMGRSEQMTELVIDSQVTLRAGAEHLEVQTTVDNVACDHRLRVLLPTGANTSTCLADSPFDVVQRPVALLADNHLYRELEVETRPQQTWTAALDQQRGLAVVAEGLHETAVRDLPERPLALTLFRSTQRTVFTAGQPEGQLQGRMTFRYWIVPLPGRCDVPRLCHLGQLLNAGLRDIQLRALDVALHRQAKALPPTAGLVQVDGPAVVTSFRQVASANELRMFNPTDTAAEVALSFRQWPGKAPATAQPVDLESHPVGAAIGAKEGVIQLRLKAKQILTVRLL